MQRFVLAFLTTAVCLTVFSQSKYVLVVHGGAGVISRENMAPEREAACAVSATGRGEYFMRNVVAYDISALMEYKSISLEEAANEVIMGKLSKLGGTGGVIAIDKAGNFVMTFNTPGMFRGYSTSRGKREIAIYK